MTSCHYTINDINSKVVDNQFYTAHIDIKPRIKDKVWKNPTDDLLKPKWRLGISLFKNYKYDTPEQFDKCFEFDWKSTKIERFVKQPKDMANLKKLVRKYYKYIKFAYKWFSAQNNLEIFCCTMNSM